MKYSRFTSLWVIICLLAVSLFLLAPKVAPDFVDTFDRESGWVEMLSALCYLFGFLVCAYRIISRATGDRPYLYLWAFLCFMFFGEETSWLQHMIGYGTPDAIREINVQEELNIHNLVLDGSWHDALASGKVSYRLFLNTTTLFRLGFFSYFVLVPILMHAGLLKGARKNLRFPLPSIAFLVTLCATLSISVVGYLLSPDSRLELTEAREAFYAFFVMLYVLIHLGVDPSPDVIPENWSSKMR